MYLGILIRPFLGPNPAESYSAPPLGLKLKREVLGKLSTAPSSLMIV